MKAAVIILNWNGCRFLETYLPQVVQYTLQEGVSVVVADNGSTDGSAAYVAANHPEVTWLPLDRNYGFAEGYNRAIAQTEADFVVLLNSDVEVTPGWLGPLLARMEADDRVAAVMPKLRAVADRSKFEYAGAAGGFIDRYGYAFCRGRLFGEVEADEGQYDDAREVFWATGACCAVRREACLAAGGLDAFFFAHMEEIDLCWRMKNAGLTVWYEPASTVYHVGGGTLPQNNPYKTFLNYRNNLLMLYKNLPQGRCWSTLLCRMVLDGISACRVLFSKGGPALFAAIVKAHVAFWRAVPRYRRQMKGHARPVGWPSQMVHRSVVSAHFLHGIKKFSDL
ncbi:MAG: glycosyltransferase family 2 protein [Bacteroidales bacterium]|nr:glycosyltransferase family 2 protein [Bacteroidales bacterium]